MKTVIIVLIIGSWMALQMFLSRRKQKSFGLIIPLLIIIGGLLFDLFMVKDGKRLEGALAFFGLFIIHIGIYFEGRESLKKQTKKELDKMSIHNLK